VWLRSSYEFWKKATPIRFAPLGQIGQRERGLRLVRQGESPADPVVLCDGNIEKHLRRFAAVGQCKEFVSDFDVFFDLLNEGCAFFTEL
jgi:hypothetical protein